MKFLEDKDAIREVVFTRIHNLYDEAAKKSKEKKADTSRADPASKKKAEDLSKAEQKNKEESDKFQKQASEISTTDSQEEAVEDKPQTTGNTAIQVVKNNSATIFDVLWRFLTKPRRQVLDAIFYDALKKNDIFFADLNAKDEEFGKMVSSKLAQNKKTEEKAAAQPKQPEKTEPVVSSVLKTTKGEPLPIKENFEELVMEALLGDIAKGILGLKPQKVKEIQLNAKTIYNNCVLILTLERYILNVLTAFMKQNNIKVESGRYGDEASFDEDNPEVRQQLLNTFSSIHNIAEPELKDLISALKTLRYLEKMKGNLSEDDIKEQTNAKNGLEKLKKTMGDAKFKSLVADLKKNKLITESIEIKEEELITEVFGTISNILKQTFKVIQLGDMNQQRFNAYCNYLFTNKQFFIEQTKMLNKYLGTYQTFGNSFYQILGDFNALDEDIKSKLVESSFSDASNFNNLFPVIEKVSKIIALTITREVKKEIDRIMPASYKAGVKTGEFLGRLVSGHSQTKPIESGTTAEN